MTAVVRRCCLALGIALWIVVPVVVLVAGTRGAASTRLAPVGPVWSAVLPQDQSGRQPVGLALDWGTPIRVYAPAWTGIVEQVRARPGGVIAEFDRPFVVHGLAPVAFSPSIPFERPLSNGLAGADVASLNRLLAGLRLEHGDADRFTDATERGVVALSKTVGVTPAATFDPSWVLYLPETPFLVTSLALYVGQPAPPGGTEIAEGGSALRSATVVPPIQDAGGGAGGGNPGASAGASGGASGGAQSTPPTIDPASEAIAVPEGSTLEVGGRSVALSDRRTTVAPAALAAVVAVVQPTVTAVDAFIVTPPSPGQWRVPAASVFPGDGTGNCVVRRRHGASSGVAVRVVSSQYGVTTVNGDLRTGDDVEAQVPASGRRCPSR